MNEATANISWLPFDPRDWEQLTPAFGQLKSVVAPHGPKLIANSHTAAYFDQCVHDGRLELALVRPDLMYRLFDEAERKKLTIRVPLNYEEGCGIEPYYEGRWYARRSGLEKLTAIPVTPVARAEPTPLPKPAGEVGDQGKAAETAGTQSKKRRGTRPKKRRGTRGPAPEKTDLVANKIRDDIRAKRFTMQEWRTTREGRARQEGRLFEGSRRVSQKKLRAEYGCSSSTLLDALNIVWSELRKNSERKTPSENSE